jgi:hypothetical protein
MQGGDPNNRITAAEMKHYTAYGVESNRFGFRGYVSVYDMVGHGIVSKDNGMDRMTNASYSEWVAALILRGRLILT